jgi:hypothetical protein
VAASLTVLLLALTFNAPCAFAGIIFQQDFESTAVGAVPSNLSPQSHGSQNTFAVVESPARAGGKSMRLKLQYVNSESYRAEVLPINPRVEYQFGTEYWVGYSEYLLNWASDTKSECVSQAHASNPADTNCGAGSCSYMGGISAGNSYSFRVHLPTGCQSGGNSAWPPTAAFTTNVVSGQWVDWVLHFKNATNNTGFYEIWRNGTLVYSVYNTVTAQALWAMCCTQRPANQLVYIPKWGIYKWDWKTAPSAVNAREMFLDEIKIWEGAGGSYAAVAPAGGALANPVAPSNLTATLISSNQINLAWTDNSTNETQFRIERKIGGGGFAFLTNRPALAGSGGTGNYSDTNLSAGTTYTYRVRADGSNGNSGWSSEVSTNTPGGGGGVTNLYEAELLPATGSSGDVISTYAETGASGGTNSLLTANAVGDFITYTVSVPLAGTYNVRVRLPKFSNCGKCFLYVDGSASAQGAEMDLYNASVFAYEEVNLGDVTFTNAGNHAFRFQVSGKNAASTFWKLTFDYLRLIGSTPVPPVIGGAAVSNNSFVLTFSTVSGGQYEVQRTDTLNPPGWTPVATNISGTGGVTQITDTNAMNRSNTFYRVKRGL